MALVSVHSHAYSPLPSPLSPFSPSHSLSSLPFGQIVPFVQGASGLDGRPGPPVSVISPSPFPCPSLSGLWIPLVFPAVAVFAPHPHPCCDSAPALSRHRHQEVPSTPSTPTSEKLFQIPWPQCALQDTRHAERGTAEVTQAAVTLMSGPA